jgi:biotin carboxyl carrier protein
LEDGGPKRSVAIEVAVNFLEMEEAVKLKARTGDREDDLLLKLEEGRIWAEIGNRVYTLDVRETEPDSYLFFLNTNVHECRVRPQPGSKDTFEVSTGGRSYSVTIVDPKRLRSGQNSDRHHHGVAEIRAPMPGKIVRVQLEAGATVEQGVGVVVVEAMKMQNEMKSPRAGVVVSINVKPGDTVNAGDVLAVIE